MNTIRTSFHEAASEGDLEKVKALLKENADLVFSKDNYGYTPLHEAAACGHKEVTEWLLANKAEVNVNSNNGKTPLHLAVAYGRKEVTRLLLANKAEVNAKTNDGFTPLHLAMSEGHKDVAELLRQHGGLDTAPDKSDPADSRLNGLRGGLAFLGWDWWLVRSYRSMGSGPDLQSVTGPNFGSLRLTISKARRPHCLRACNRRVPVRRINLR